MKVLMLRPQDICYGIVDTFADNLGAALRKAGAEVIYFDLKKEPVQNLRNYINESYTAVIDFYSGLLSVKVHRPEEYLLNCMDASVFQICVDFPVYIMDKMDAELNKYYALCLDRHYCGVIKECMPNINGSYFFPMAGREGNQKLAWEERSHDLVFIGSYSNYREWLAELDRYEEGIRKIGYAFFCTMRDHTELDQKQAFEMALSKLGIRLEKKEFYQWMKMIGGIAMSAAAYQRERLLEVLLQAGLKVEVYGNSWTNSPFTDYQNLMIHDQVNEKEYIAVLERTKLSLNIMYCNQAGYTERYSYSMLNGAVCISDQTEYLSQEFTDGENIVFYQLDQLDQLPEKIKRLLACPEEASAIADRAYKKAKQEHTWEARTELFLNILEECK